MRWHLSHRERYMSSLRSMRMRSVSRSDAQIYYTFKTPSWTYDPRSGTYYLSLLIFIETLVRTNSRSRRCFELSWTDCLQQQDLMHHHQPRDVFVTSWFIFIPLALFFFFIYYINTLWTVQILSLRVFLSCVHI
jgi:hypothetical protein